MSLPPLIPFPKIKEIINAIPEDQVVDYDGLVASQKNVEHGSVSIVQLKVVFNDEPDKDEESE